MGIVDTIKNYITKLSPAQEVIYREEGTDIYTNSRIDYLLAFNRLETVNRGVNMIVSACSSLDYDIKEKKLDGAGVRVKTLNNLLNYQPNPYQSVQEFRINMFTDFLLEGNVFLYWDGVHLYHLPASKVVIEPDPKTFVRRRDAGQNRPNSTP